MRILSSEVLENRGRPHGGAVRNSWPKVDLSQPSCKFLRRELTVLGFCSLGPGGQNAGAVSCWPKIGRSALVSNCCYLSNVEISISTGTLCS